MTDEKLKVLLVTFSDNADHQEVIYSLFEELLGQCQVWAMGIQNPKVPLKKDSHIRFVNAPLRPGIGKGTFRLPELFKILKFVFSEQFDVVYFETLHTWNIPIWIFHPRKTLVIQAIHDVDPHEGDSNCAMIELMNRTAVCCADRICLRNDKFMELAKRKYNVQPERLSALNPWRRFPPYNKLHHTGRVLFFGRINEYKGIEYLPQIVKLCPEITFDIVGRADPAVMEIVETLRKNSNVSVKTEYVTDDEMVDFFKNSDLVILPYKSASQSGVVLDANKFGRPVVAFEVGAIGNQVKNSINGILVPSGAVEEFASAVKKVMGMSFDQLDDFSKKSYEYAYERFSSKNAARNFLELIKKEVNDK